MSETSAVETKPDQLDQRVDSLERRVEAALLEQEHRAFRVLYNFFVRRREWPAGDERRVATWSALIWRWLSPTSPVVVVAGGALFSFVAASLAYQANDLLASQNRWIQAQTALEESSRRSALVFELSEILSEIDEEMDAAAPNWRCCREAGAEEPGACSPEAEKTSREGFCLEPRTYNRIIALSRSLKPYSYLVENAREEKPSGLADEIHRMWLGLTSTTSAMTDGASGSLSRADAEALVRPADNAQLRRYLSGATALYFDVGAARSKQVDIAHLRTVLLPSTSGRGALLSAPLSPERGQLFLSLVESGVAIQPIVRNGDFRASDLRGAALLDLSQELQFVKLSKADLAHAQLRGLDLSFSDLKEADLSGASIDSSKFSAANLSFVDFSEASVSSCDFEFANLVAARFDRATFHSRQVMAGAVGSFAALVPTASKLRRADLSLSSLRATTLDGADLRGARLIYAEVVGANLADVNLEEADLEAADLRDATLKAARLKGANLRRADLRGAIGLVQSQIDEACTDESTRTVLVTGKNPSACERWKDGS